MEAQVSKIFISI